MLGVPFSLGRGVNSKAFTCENAHFASLNRMPAGSFAKWKENDSSGLRTRKRRIANTVQNVLYWLSAAIAVADWRFAA